MPTPYTNAAGTEADCEGGAPVVVFPRRLEALARIIELQPWRAEHLHETRPRRLDLRPQAVGAYDGFVIEGTYRSAPYANPYILRADGRFMSIFGREARA